MVVRMLHGLVGKLAWCATAFQYCGWLMPYCTRMFSRGDLSPRHGKTRHDLRRKQATYRCHVFAFYFSRSPPFAFPPRKYSHTIWHNLATILHWFVCRLHDKLHSYNNHKRTKIITHSLSNSTFKSVLWVLFQLNTNAASSLHTYYSR